jgi:hypothetical protein
MTRLSRSFMVLPVAGRTGYRRQFLAVTSFCLCPPVFCFCWLQLIALAIRLAWRGCMQVCEIVILTDPATIMRYGSE